MKPRERKEIFAWEECKRKESARYCHLQEDSKGGESKSCHLREYSQGGESKVLLPLKEIISVCVCVCESKEKIREIFL